MKTYIRRQQHTNLKHQDTKQKEPPQKPKWTGVTFIIGFYQQIVTYFHPCLHLFIAMSLKRHTRGFRKYHFSLIREGLRNIFVAIENAFRTGFQATTYLT